MSPSYYAGPTRGQLQIDSWSDLIAAIQAGSMTESQWIECKEAVPAASPGANLEIAKDLASLTVDGGVLVIGVKDKATTPEDVCGVADDVEGLKSRITQIAAGPRVQPPMQVVFGDPLPHPEDESRLVLLVSVPASPSAPHMVDGSYWGRSAVGKRKLTDREVERLFAQRRASRDDFEERLRAFSLQLDPYPPEERQLAHLYVFARPEIRAHDGFINQLEQGNGLTAAITGALQATSRPTRHPDFFALGRNLPHPDGLFREYAVDDPSSDRRVDEAQCLRLLVDSAGAICVASGRGSYPRRDGTSDIDFDYIIEVLHQTIALAGYLGRNAMSYDGMWVAGVHLTGLKGALGRSPSVLRYEVGRPFATEEYTRVCPATTATLADEPFAVVEQLLRDLARGIGFRGDLRQYLDSARQ